MDKVENITNINWVLTTVRIFHSHNTPSFFNSPDQQSSQATNHSFDRLSVRPFLIPNELGAQPPSVHAPSKTQTHASTHTTCMQFIQLPRRHFPSRGNVALWLECRQPAVDSRHNISIEVRQQFAHVCKWTHSQTHSLQDTSTQTT